MVNPGSIPGTTQNIIRTSKNFIPFDKINRYLYKKNMSSKFKSFFPNVKIPLTIEMYDYYINLGYKCFIIDDYFHISTLAEVRDRITNVVKPKCFSIEDVKYILSIDCDTIRKFIHKVNIYISQKYYNGLDYYFLDDYF